MCSLGGGFAGVWFCRVVLGVVVLSCVCVCLGLWAFGLVFELLNVTVFLCVLVCVCVFVCVCLLVVHLLVSRYHMIAAVSGVNCQL